MKQLLFLFVVLSSFSMPPVLVDDKKNDWVYELNKPVKATMSDYMVVYQTPSTSCQAEEGYSGITQGAGETNSVSIGRLWEVEWNTTTGTYFTVMYIQPGTHYFYIYNRNNWACGSTVTGTWSRPYGW